MQTLRGLSDLADQASDFRHRLRSWWDRRRHHKEYREYLRIQLNRSLSKRPHYPRLRTHLLTEQLVALNGSSPDSMVLCIGSRDGFELEYFRQRGFDHTVGIDLFSERPDILVMDMHDLKFPSDYFDIVYSCHSLEHAYDANAVTQEIIRVARPGALVAIEVPIRYETTAADRIDFRNLEGLLHMFQGHVARVLWCEEQPPQTPRNESGTAILRTIFSVSKSPS